MSRKYLKYEITTGQTFIGDIKQEELPSIQFTHYQMVPVSEIELRHNLGKVPHVLITDYYEQEKITGNVVVIDDNTIRIKFDTELIFKVFMG